MSYQIIKGPALLRGQCLQNLTVRTKGDIRIAKNRAVTPIETDGNNVMDLRLKDVVHQVSFTPSGQWDDITALLTPPASYYKGQKIITPVSVGITAVADAGGGICTITIASAQTVYKGQYIYITGASAGDEAYNGARLVSADSSGTSVSVVMTFGSTATATMKIPPCLIIHPLNQYAESEYITIYQCAGVTGLPNVKFSTAETFMGEATISCVYNPYQTAADAEALLRQATWAAVESGVLDDLDVTKHVTAAPRLRYAAPDVNEFSASDSAAAPWRDFRTLDGLSLTFDMTLNADETDYRGTQNWTFGGLSLSMSAVPVSGVPTDEITDASVQALLREQDDGADGLMRGVTLKASTPLEFLALMNVPGVAGYNLRVPHAVITAANAAHGTAAPRNGAMTWRATRKITSGAESALYTFDD